MADTIIINGDVVGRDKNAKRKPEETRERDGQQASDYGGRSGGVKICGRKVTIGGKVVSGDKVEEK